MRTRTLTLRRHAAGFALVLLAGAFAAGCGEDTASDLPPVGEFPGGGADDAPQIGTLVAPDVRVDGVLLAALLLGSGGDLEAAVATGLVSPAEVDTAAAALAEGSLSAWVAEAGVPAG